MLIRLLTTAGLLFAVLATAPAQGGRAELLGIVRDASGSAIPRVSARGEEVATGRVFETVASDSGAFHLLGLPPGEYRLTLDREGFATHRREGVRLSAGDRVTIDVVLQIGAFEESVEVRAGAPLLQVGHGTVSAVIAQRQVADLPLDGRDFIPLIATLPGVAMPRGSSFPRLNGSRPRTNEYIYDGVSVLQPEPGQTAYQPIIDAIEELRVDLNSYSAEYGRSNGGVVRVTHRSGTNEFHGTAFEFFRHEKLNARNLFAPAGPKPRFRRNQFGFVAGGPIRRNRTFFFGEFQGSRLRTERTLISTVPTADERGGRFAQPIFDPATTVPTLDGARRDAFPNQTVPANRLDRVTGRLLSRFPTANQSGAANNFRRQAVESQDQDQFAVRLDHDWNERHRTFLRYARFDDDTLPAAPLPDGGGLISSGALGDSLTRSDSVVAEHSWTPSPRAVNQLRFGFNRRAFQSEMGRLARPAAEELGLPNLPANSFSNVLPVFAADGFQQLGPTANANRDFTTSVTQFVDTLSLIRSSHVLKIGADIRLQRLDMLQPADPTGRFRFTSPFTAQPGVAATGSSFASMLLGQVESFRVDLQPEELRPRASNAEFYVQDDWRASSRLTLNLGLRYTLNFPSTEADDRAAFFDVNRQELRFLGQEDVGDSARKLHYGNFGPRVGLAWRVNERVAVRAGYGLAWFEMAGITTPFTTPFFPFIQTIGEASLDNLTAAFQLADGPSVQPAPIGPDAGLGQGVFAVNRDTGSGYSQQWNLTIQTTAGRDWSFQVGYLGSAVTRLGVPDGNINQLTADQLAAGATLLETVPNPFFGAVPAASSLGRPTISRAQLLKPFPRFANVGVFRDNIGRSSYHGLQTSVEKRLSDGFSLRASYTFSKLIDDASSVFSASSPTGPPASFPIADSLNRRIEKDVSRGDIPHVFSAAFVYELPFARRARGWVRALFGDWRAAGIARLQSGLPVAVEQRPNFNSFAGFGSQRPNITRDPRLSSAERSTARFFDVAAFSAASQFTLGDASRHPARGPGWRTLDLMLAKEIPVGERFRAEFRVEAFNLTNTPPLGDPNGLFGTPAFGSITSAGDPRVYEFVVKLHF